jgi:hypothetical protein
MPKVNPLCEPRMQALVRMAAAEGNYDAVRDAFTLAERLVPPGADFWSWWLDAVEALTAGSEDFALAVKFTREVAGINPWGELPAGARQRLRNLGQ